MAFVVGCSFCPLTRRILNIRHAKRAIRAFSTSDKKKDGVSTASDIIPKNIPDFSKPLENKNWVSYGFDRNDEKVDLNATHNVLFLGVTLCFVFGGFYIAYFPDFKDLEWSQREAFLEIRRREALGIPLIDKDYVDPVLIKLPTDEELGDTPIII